MSKEYFGRYIKSTGQFITPDGTKIKMTYEEYLTKVENERGIDAANTIRRRNEDQKIKQNNRIREIMCQICGITIAIPNNIVPFNKHIKQEHNINAEYYYNTYINTNANKNCPICGLPTKFKSILYGYSSTCGNKECITSYLSKKSSSDEFQTKKRMTTLERYGVEHHLQNPIIIQKQIDTDLARYGVRRPLENKKIKEKMINTSKENRDENWTNKRKQTMQETYGTTTPFDSKEIYEKRSITMSEKTKTNTIMLETQKTIGSGAECVYLYYYNIYKLFAENNGKTEFECRLCAASTEDPTNIIKQYSLASPELPIIALVIKCDNAVGLKQTIQYMLATRNKKIETISNDWFITNPSEIENLYKLIIGE